MTPARKKKKKVQNPWIDAAAESATKWLGSTSSLIVHTGIFVVAAVLPFLGIQFDLVLLVVTTAVSLEAIYMNIFIQMAVNKNTADIEEIQGDMGEIQEDVEEIQEDVDEIQKDVDEIQEDVDEIQKDVDEIQEDIEEDVEEETQQQKEMQILSTIQNTLSDLQKEIEQLKHK